MWRFARAGLYGLSFLKGELPKKMLGLKTMFHTEHSIRSAQSIPLMLFYFTARFIPVDPGIFVTVMVVPLVVGRVPNFVNEQNFCRIWAGFVACLLKKR